MKAGKKKSIKDQTDSGRLPSSKSAKRRPVVPVAAALER
jgi:hypothetical protein